MRATPVEVDERVDRAVRCLEAWTDRPFEPADLSAGSETELQTAVRGDGEAVDLPRTIRGSGYYDDVLRRSGAGDTPRRSLHRLQRWLDEEGVEVWENSWLRFPLRVLGRFARATLEQDLGSPSGRRSDAGRFLFQQGGEPWLRLPISYVLKLALADVVDDEEAGSDPSLRAIAERLMRCFVEDNTSPETHSFHVVSARAGSSIGDELARETALRFLLTQFLIEWANQRFELRENGQEALIFSSPHPPVRQQALAESVAGTFYRELFISPCLSGWSEGETKRDYMELCHQVLGRSRVQAVARLQEAGIVTRRRVVLPRLSEVALSNNATHVSLGSRALGARRESGELSAEEEASYTALVLKVAEHFLPLFVGTYSAAPLRIGFADFHPERVLGFLPHELDDTHLRRLWRRWSKQVAPRVFGCPGSPFGVPWFDELVARGLRLPGVCVADGRLLDYPVALRSTARGSALDGSLDGEARAKADLQSAGVFDSRLSIYLPLKARRYEAHGFSGVESRIHSLFPAFRGDLGAAVDLQAVVLQVAHSLVRRGAVRHRDLRDDPESESERRQSLFAAAVGVPTFYVAEHSRNRLLRRILARTTGTRRSRRYPGHVRVPVAQYRRGLVEFLRRHAEPDRRSSELLDDLEDRLRDPRRGAAGRLMSAVVEEAGCRSPLQLEANDFNRRAEGFYRGKLCSAQVDEAFGVLQQEWRSARRAGEAAAWSLSRPGELLRRTRAAVRAGETPSRSELRSLIHLFLRIEGVRARRDDRVLERAS